MKPRKGRPGSSIHAAAVLIALTGCLIAAVVVDRWFPGWPETLGFEVALDDLTQVVVPGSEDISSAQSGALCPRCDPPAHDCTIFTVSKGDRVFFGGNGDWTNFEGNYYWVDPGSDTRYGAIYFGVPENVQQGFNEKGLAYDSNGLPRAPVRTHPGNRPVFGGHSSCFIRILQECATVEDVIIWVQEHQWHLSLIHI